MAMTLVVVLGLSLYNAVRVRSGSSAPDDYFISLRYAEQLTAGDGFRWNPGGERVEGFSSPLHVLLLAAAIRAGVPPLVASQLSSLLPAMAVVIVLLVWGRTRLGPPWGTLAALSLGLSPSFSLWSRGGLETTIFTFMVLAAVIAGEQRRPGWLAVALGLLAWTRPEGPLYMGAAGLAVYLSWGRDRAALRQALRVVGGAALVFLPWLVFRLVYFGYPLANTYYAKMDGVRSVQALRGLDYVRRFVALSEVHTPLILAGLGLVAYVVTRRAGRGGPVPVWPVFALALAAATITFAVLSGGDHMIQYRFMVPALPLFAALGAGGAAAVAAAAPRRVGRLVATVVLGFVLVSQPLRIFGHDLEDPHFPLDRPLSLVELDNNQTTSLYYRLGLALGRTQPADAVIAVVPAGAIPFASGLTAIDMLGLNDVELAHMEFTDMGAGRQGHEKGDGGLILARQPDLILLNHYPAPVFGELVDPGALCCLIYRPVRQIWNDEAFQRDYEPFNLAIDDSTSYTLYRRRTEKTTAAGAPFSPGDRNRGR